jgi:5'-3' exonuclease
MGVPLFYPYIKRNYPKRVVNIRNGYDLPSLKVKVDVLMIDLNGLFHPSAQKIYQYGAHKPLKQLMRQPSKKPSPLTLQLRVFEDICKTIENLVDKVRPTKDLVLCVDGVAPRGKQSQQRSRRYKGSLEHGPDNFDPNCMTPGTKFMDHLTRYIDWYIHRRICESDMWKPLRIFFSSEKAAQEGEQKAISYIRKYTNTDLTYCIHGLDADIIMLALSTHLPKIYVLRDDIYNHENEFNLIDVGGLHADLSANIAWNNHSYNEITAIDDFVFMCFMVGNDFLPHVPSLEIIEDGIDHMLDVYRQVGSSYGHLTRKSKSKGVIFCKKALKIFLGTISHYDKEILSRKYAKTDSYFPDELMNKFITIDANSNVCLNISGYRDEYHDTKFAHNDIEEVCHHYLDGLQWVLSYYTGGVPDWKWSYPHHYAPFAHELATHIKTFKFVTRPSSQPSTPFQQLLSVLPPKSAQLIPEPMSSLLTNVDSPLLPFCPTKFDIDLSGKRQDWEGIVLLPHVNFNVIETEHDKLIDKVDKKELYRNTLTRSRIYTYSDTRIFEYKSFYGNIPDCHVIYELVDL